MTRMAQDIHIQLNGKTESVPIGTTVRSLLESRQVNANTVACELNLKIIRRAVLGETILNEGDALEIIHMVGGG